MLFVGASSAWADEVFGTTSDGYLASKSTSITMYDGGTLHYEFSQTTRATNNYDGFVLVAEDRGGAKLIALRQDNWDNIASSNLGCTNNYNWTDFPALMNGATVDMTITYNNGTFEMTSTITGSDANSYNYGYTKAIAGSPAAIVVYLSEEASQITLTTSEYSNSNVVATLVHTAHVEWGKDTGASTCDAETEYFNFDAGSNTWSAAAFAEYSFTIPDGHSITSATLYWRGTSAKAYGSTFYYLNVGQSFSFDPLPAVGTNMQYSGNKTLISNSIPSLQSGVSVTTDITSAVSAVFAGNQNSIILQWTGNNGGASLYGKGSDAYSPILIIKTSAEILYTATFTETNSLTPTVTIYSDAGRTTPVTNGTLRNGQTYYYTATSAAYRDYQGSFTVDGADPNVNFTMTAKEIFNYTVNAIDESSNLLYKITDGSVYENENVTIAFNAFYLKSNGDLLQADRIDDSKKQYRYTFNVDEANKVVTVTYKATSYSNVVFYKEAEDVATLTVVESGNVPVRCSGAKGAIATSDAIITTLGPGKYKLSSFAWGNAGTNLEVYAGENLIHTFTTSASTLSITTSDEFTLNASTDIIFKAGGNGGGSPKVLDFFFIQQTASPATIGSTGWTTFASAHPLDLSNMTASTGDVTAYYASAVNNGSVTMTSTESSAVAAGEGLMLKGTAGATITIPVVASGTAIEGNKLVGCTTSTVLTANSNYYVLVNNSGTAEFQCLDTNGATIPAGKAYLNVPSAGANLRISFDADETTGINAVEGTESTNGIYNLNGQRIMTPTKGLYIMNGKKVFIK